MMIRLVSQEPAASDGAAGFVRLLTAAASTLTVTARFVAGDPAIDDGAGAADTGFDIDRFDRAVFCTGAALYAAVAVDDPGFFFLNGKDRMWADCGAHPTTDAGRLIVFKGDDTFEIAKFRHYSIPY